MPSKDCKPLNGSEQRLKAIERNKLIKAELAAYLAIKNNKSNNWIVIETFLKFLHDLNSKKNLFLVNVCGYWFFFKRQRSE